MNKMNLPPPFGPVRKQPAFPSHEAVQEVATNQKDEIKYYGKSQIPEKEVEEDDDEEGEYEDKRQKLDSEPLIDNPFSKTSISISVNTKSSHPSQQMQPVTAKVVPTEKNTVEGVFATPASERNCVSRQDIMKHRISKEEMAQHKAFSNYAYGESNSKLFIRNLAKDTTEDDILRIFGCFFDNDDEAKKSIFGFILIYRQLEIKIMTGRMKGQAFVTFPSIESAREALVTVNGYVFKDKPIVVVR